MHALAQKLNFTWQIQYPLAGEYGSTQSDGSEDGIVGEARKLNQSRIFKPRSNKIF